MVHKKSFFSGWGYTQRANWDFTDLTGTLAVLGKDISRNSVKQGSLGLCQKFKHIISAAISGFCSH